MDGWKMRPTTSALGVIAIVSVMITATASETGSGPIEHSINHLGDGVEEERYLPEDGRPMNESGRVERGRSGFFHRNDTATEMTGPRDPVYLPTTEPDSRNVSNGGGDVTDVEPAELQRDQSDVRGAVRPSNDPWNDTSHGNDPAGSEHRIGQDVVVASGSREETSTGRDLWLVTSGSSRPENTTWKSLLESRMVPASKMIEPDRSKDRGPDSPDHGKSAVPGSEGDGTSGSTAYVVQETIGFAATEIVAIEQKNVEDIRAISFQVPPPEPAEVDGTERQMHRPDGKGSNAGKTADETRKFSETKKEHSRPLNNLLVGGKSTKAFYEIKPSIKTEMEKSNEHQPFPSTQRSLTARKFILPSVDSAFGKFGPYFEDGDKEINITARIGSTVLLDCKIGMLGDKEVTWAQHSKDSFRLLTVGRTPYSADQRISPNFRYPNNWRLQILYASPRDSGLYKCQVATHPPLVKKINVIVTAPELTITDDSGRIVPKERHLKAGSALKLRCEARDVLESLEESVVWTRGDETLTEDVSENRTTEISAGKEVLVIVSTLIVERASPRHAGNYSCLVPGKAKTTIAVHVLNGELPAAVHDGNGVSRSFLNLWLIHLTMSYVFSR